MLSQAQTMANKFFSPKTKLRLGGTKKRQSKLDAERLQQQQQQPIATMPTPSPKPARPNRCVSFDMLGHSPTRHSQRVASIVLNAQHSAYKSMRYHRAILVALDGHVPLQTDSPLHWLLNSMASAGDHIICVHRPRRVNNSENHVSETTRDARDLFEATVGLVSTICPDVPLKVTLEYGVGGAAHRMIQSLIGLYAPSMLVMGPSQGEIDAGISSLVSSHGRDAIKHSLQYSQVPVIVVRPEQEREAHREERKDDRSYAEILQEACGGVHESDWKDTGGLILYPEEVIRSRESSGPGGAYGDDRLRRESESDNEEGEDSDEGGEEFEVASGAQILAQLESVTARHHCIPGGADVTAADNLLLFPRRQQGLCPLSKSV